MNSTKDNYSCTLEAFDAGMDREAAALDMRADVIATCAQVLDRAKVTSRECDDGTMVDTIYDAWEATAALPNVRARFVRAINADTEFRAPVVCEALGY